MHHPMFEATNEISAFLLSLSVFFVIFTAGTTCFDLLYHILNVHSDTSSWAHYASYTYLPFVSMLFRSCFILSIRISL